MAIINKYPELLVKAAKLPENAHPSVWESVLKPLSARMATVGAIEGTKEKKE